MCTAVLLLLRAFAAIGLAVLRISKCKLGPRDAVVERSPFDCHVPTKTCNNYKTLILYPKTYSKCLQHDVFLDVTLSDSVTLQMLLLYFKSAHACCERYCQHSTQPCSYMPWPCFGELWAPNWCDGGPEAIPKSIGTRVLNKKLACFRQRVTNWRHCFQRKATLVRYFLFQHIRLSGKVQSGRVRNQLPVEAFRPARPLPYCMDTFVYLPPR